MFPCPILRFQTILPTKSVPSPLYQAATSKHSAGQPLNKARKPRRDFHFNLLPKNAHRCAGHRGGWVIRHPGNGCPADTQWLGRSLANLVLTLQLLLVLSFNCRLHGNFERAPVSRGGRFRKVSVQAIGAILSLKKNNINKIINYFLLLSTFRH